MADQPRPTPPQAPEPTYELEWESRVQQPKRRSRLSRLFPIGGGVAPEDPEAVAPAPPPPPPRRPSSFQRKPLTGATTPAAIPTPAAPSTSDDDLAQQTPLTKEAQQQHQPPLARDGAPVVAGQTEQEPANSDKAEAAAAGVGAARSSPRARLDSMMPPNRRHATARIPRRGRRPPPAPPGPRACGGSHGDGDMIVAVARSVFDAAANEGDGNPNNNPICGRRIRVERGDVSVDVAVVDRCEGCKPTDLDLSPSAFQRLAREGDGRVVGQWRWL
ncbi:LOW QUALITY PROTEIN: hypothetical protein GGTG_06457 [Gaeumannomyces tritici R3-111a-1]|uniref:RlpA-like protein double-psi beta-barrel domain-containing protein n=1 Tax=Gaeumannomyces tritici (strain R3-111a-1) TaxID=644352 RepID=J3NYV5_GAET3|nr:LOW QUALITY PROTEIN: hypothetical protein GGTG_06457 [Gaeumannomyces tritici R3-111a-1]EJT76538.1 LOW QUALITY PROTEIN: hypothetical protein GGTG_06457 [Gaeumannomyces tritici R3-111a-1]